jgi:hypothetical protein
LDGFPRGMEAFMNLTIDPEPRPSSVRLAGCIRRGDMVAAAAAEYCAAGERGAAWQAQLKC